jgi:hypothetical protein
MRKWMFAVLLLVLQAGCYAHRHGRGGYNGGGPGYGPPSGYAGGNYGMAGCGLGALIFGPVDEPSVQLLAATTNAGVSQTFGISSGTSNCISGGVVRAEREQAAFAEVNFLDLKRNMAAGGGEYLRSFAALLGCEESAKPPFFKMTQERFEKLVPSESTGPIDLVVATKAEVRAHPDLASACSDERAIARSTAGSRLASAR